MPLPLAAGRQHQRNDAIFSPAPRKCICWRIIAIRLGIPLFDRAVDFGRSLLPHQADVLTCSTSSIGIIGNFGLAILALTICVRLLLFPLANKSFRAMNKMKKLTPLMTELRERYKDDKQKLNQGMMELYKREKVNPAAGLPADLRADPRLHLPLQDAVRHHRDAPRAVLRLDQGSFGTAIPPPGSTVSACPLAPAAGAGTYPVIGGITAAVMAWACGPS